MEPIGLPMRSSRGSTCRVRRACQIAQPLLRTGQAVQAGILDDIRSSTREAAQHRDAKQNLLRWAWRSTRRASSSRRRRAPTAARRADRLRRVPAPAAHCSTDRSCDTVLLSPGPRTICPYARVLLGRGSPAHAVAPPRGDLRTRWGCPFEEDRRVPYRCPHPLPCSRGPP